MKIRVPLTKEEQEEKNLERLRKEKIDFAELAGVNRQTYKKYRGRTRRN